MENGEIQLGQTFDVRNYYVLSCRFSGATANGFQTVKTSEKKFSESGLNNT